MYPLRLGDNPCPGITETTRMRLALFGMQNRTLDPWLAANNRMLALMMQGVGAAKRGHHDALCAAPRHGDAAGEAGVFGGGGRRGQAGRWRRRRCQEGRQAQGRRQAPEALKAIGYAWSYLACRTGQLVPIWRRRTPEALTPRATRAVVLRATRLACHD
jgi:hypothetical protein